MGKMGKRKKEQSKPQGKQTDIRLYLNKVSPAQSTNQVQGSASTAPHRGGGTTRIPEGIRATSYPNKKRRMQRYESDTEDEVGIFHGININNNISESSQEDLFLKFYSNKSEYFPYTQPDSYLNTGTSIKRNRPNNSPQNNNWSPLQSPHPPSTNRVGGNR